MNLYDLAKSGASVEEVLKAVKKQDKEYMRRIVRDLYGTDRFDVLEVLKKNRRFKKEAEMELRIHYNMQRMHKEFEDQVAKYPPQLREFHEIMVPCNLGGGLFAVNYPSRMAKEFKLEGDYFAFSGEGFLIFIMEIVSLEGEGAFKLVDRDGDHWRGYGIKEFKAAAKCKVGDILTTQQVKDALTKVYHPNLRTRKKIWEMYHSTPYEEQELTHV